jgi:hypothetical protein
MMAGSLFTSISLLTSKILLEPEAEILVNQPEGFNIVNETHRRK